MKSGRTSYTQRDFIALTVLALLAEQPRHPYEMQGLMRTRHKDFAIDKTRSFYDAVERLRKRGFIEAAETTRQGRHPERTVYRITAEGREELARWLSSMLATPAVEFPAFTVALNFLGALPPEAALLALKSRAASLEAGIAGLAASHRALIEELALPRVVLIELEHTCALHKAELEWVRTIMADIQQHRLEWQPPDGASELFASLPDGAALARIRTDITPLTTTSGERQSRDSTS